jgi:MFS family permease
MFGLLLGSFIGTLANQIVNVPLKAVASDLHVGIGQGTLVVTAFYVAFAVLMPVAGWTGERLGRKKVYCVAMGVFSAASIGATLAPSLDALIGFRILQGAANAFVLPNVMALIVGIAGPTKKGRALGMWAATNGLAYAVGAPLGGLIAQWWTWRIIFLPSAVLSIVGLLLCLWYLADDAGNKIELEWRGAVGLTAGTTFLLLATVMIPRVGIGSPIVWLLVLACLPLFGLFWRSATSFARPFVPAGLITDEAFTMGSIAVAAQMFCLGATMLAVPLYLERNAHVELAVAGAYMFAISISMTLLAPVAGRFTERRGFRQPIWLGLSLLVASELLLSLNFATAGLTGGALVLLLVAVGAGIAFVQTPAATAATGSRAGKHGAALGVYNLVRFASAGLGAAWVATSLELLNSYPAVFLVCSVSAVLAVVATALRFRMRPAAAKDLSDVDAASAIST